MGNRPLLPRRKGLEVVKPQATVKRNAAVKPQATPKTVTVGPLTYELTTDTSHFAAAANRANVSVGDVYGLTDRVAHEIAINPDTSTKRWPLTVVHESLHVMYDAAGL